MQGCGFFNSFVDDGRILTKLISVNTMHQTSPLTPVVVLDQCELVSSE